MPNTQKNEVVTNQQFEEPMTLIQDDVAQNKVAVAMSALNNFAVFLDEMEDTPIRLWQVFSRKNFGAFFGTGHVLANGIGIGASLIGAIPAVAKSFNKNTVDSLEGVLANCHNDLLVEFDLSKKNIRENLEEFFNKDLREIEHNYNVVARILPIESKDAKAEKRYELRYEFTGYLADILSNKISSKVKDDKNENIKYTNFTCFNVVEEVFDVDNFIKAEHNLSKEDLFKRYNVDVIYKQIIGALIKKIDNDYNYKAKDFPEVVKDLVIKNKKLSKADLACLTEEERQQLTAFAKIAPAFFNDKGKLDYKITLSESRKKVFDQVNGLSMSRFASGAWRFLNNWAYGFWLGFEPINIEKNQDDTRAWSLKQQAFALIVGGVFAGAFAIGESFIYLKNKISAQKTLETAGDKPQVSYHVNPKLKNSQLERFYLAELRKVAKRSNEGIVKSYTKAKVTKYQNEVNKLHHKFFVEDKVAANATISKAKPKNRFKRAIDFFLSKVNSVEEHVELLKEQTAEKQKFQKGTTGTARAMATGIQISFLQWVVGAGAYAGLNEANAKGSAVKVGKIFNDGAIGALFSVGSFIAGMLTGGLYFAFKELKELKIIRKALSEKCDANQTKIDELLKREKFNAALEEFMVKKEIDLPINLYPHDDRGFRRKTVKQSPGSTTLKKVLNRSAYIVGRIGTGILIFRLLPRTGIGALSAFGVLKLIGLATVGTAVAAFSWPVVVVAVSVGLIWSGIYTYKYIKQSQYKAANNFLNDIDNRLLCARNYTESLTERLGCQDPTHSMDDLKPVATSELSQVQNVNNQPNDKQENIIPLKKKDYSDASTISKIGLLPQVQSQNPPDKESDEEDLNNNYVSKYKKK